MIRDHEGLRLQAYQDSAGVWTIGYGHTRTAYGGMVIDRVEAEVLLEEDLSRFEDGVRRLVKVPITQEMFDALVSFAYNLGLSALSSSTLLARLNAGEYGEAAAEFERWVWVTKPTGEKEKLAGLVRRREHEASLFRRELAS
jgi:lysozyme